MLYGPIPAHLHTHTLPVVRRRNGNSWAEKELEEGRGNIADSQEVTTHLHLPAYWTSLDT
jgi:hypothetical protein